jgi:hypothetical protein
MTLRSLQVAAAKLERGCRFDASHGRQAPASGTAPEFCQESVKLRREPSRSRTWSHTRAIEPNELENLDLQNWLGVRDGIRTYLIMAA